MRLFTQKKNYKGSGKEIKNSKCLTVINTKGNSFDVDLKAGLRSCINNVTFMMLKLHNDPT